MKRERNYLVAALLAVGLCQTMPAARAIETTYGEDPVPNARCYDGFIDLGYGIDPIPAKSLSVRWKEWRASRGLSPPPDVFHRQVGGGTDRTAQPSIKKAQQRPGSRRAEKAPGQLRQR